MLSPIIVRQHQFQQELRMIVKTYFILMSRFSHFMKNAIHGVLDYH